MLLFLIYTAPYLNVSKEVLLSINSRSQTNRSVPIKDYSNGLLVSPKRKKKTSNFNFDATNTLYVRIMIMYVQIFHMLFIVSSLYKLFSPKERRSCQFGIMIHLQYWRETLHDENGLIKEGISGNMGWKMIVFFIVHL